MIRISSGSTFVTKRVVPVVWFVFLVIGLVVSIQTRFLLMFAIVCVQAVVGGVFVVKCFGLVDEVQDCGSFLSIRNGSRKWDVPLRDITKVTTARNPPRVVLHLAGHAGNGSIAFLPESPFVVDSLARRAEEARVG